jgi:hypothetical protein
MIAFAFAPASAEAKQFSRSRSPTPQTAMPKVRLLCAAGGSTSPGTADVPGAPMHVHWSWRTLVLLSLAMTNGSRDKVADFCIVDTSGLHRPDKRGQVARGGEPSATGYRAKALAPCSFCSEDSIVTTWAVSPAPSNCLCGAAARRVSGPPRRSRKDAAKNRVRGGTGQCRARATCFWSPRIIVSLLRPSRASTISTVAASKFGLGCRHPD